jgi:hypothetical protein
MKATRTTVARLLPLLALLALLPFATWSCDELEDEPDGPTGPASQYNPEMNATGAGISVKTKDESLPGIEYQGGDFALIAVLKDGEGRPMQGVPLTVQAETGEGDITQYFSFDVNPSITNAAGLASFEVIVAANCPPGSYRFVVRSSPGSEPVSGPTAMGFAGIKIQRGSETAITSVTLTSLASSYLVGESANFSVTASAVNCTTVNISYDATGPSGFNTTATVPGTSLTRVFSVGPIGSSGALSVIANAWCSAPVATSPVSSSVATVTFATSSGP